MQILVNILIESADVIVSSIGSLIVGVIVGKRLAKSDKTEHAKDKFKDSFTSVLTALSQGQDNQATAFFLEDQWEEIMDVESPKHDTAYIRLRSNLSCKRHRDRLDKAWKQYKNDTKDRQAFNLMEMQKHIQKLFDEIEKIGLCI